MSSTSDTAPGRPGRRAILRQLWRDLRDRRARFQIAHSFLWQVPGPTGTHLRRRFLLEHMKRAGTRLLVLPGCRFRGIEQLEVGNRVSIGYDNFLDAEGGLRIGSNVTMAPGVKIWTMRHETDDPDTPVTAQGRTPDPVVIGDDVFIASNACILPGTVLEHGCVVSAGAVVNGKSYRPYSILAGNPARVIGYRGGRLPEAAASPAPAGA